MGEVLLTAAFVAVSVGGAIVGFLLAWPILRRAADALFEMISAAVGAGLGALQWFSSPYGVESVAKWRRVQYAIRTPLAQTPVPVWLLASLGALGLQLAIVADLMTIAAIELSRSVLWSFSATVLLYDAAGYLYVRGQREQESLAPARETLPSDMPAADASSEAAGASLSGEPPSLATTIQRMVEALSQHDEQSASHAVELLKALSENPQAVQRRLEEYHRRLEAYVPVDGEAETEPLSDSEAEAFNVCAVVLNSAFQPAVGGAGAPFYWNITKALAEKDTRWHWRLAQDAASGEPGRLFRHGDVLRRAITRWAIDFPVASVLLVITLPVIGVLAALCALASGPRRVPIFVASRVGRKGESLHFFRLNASVFAGEGGRVSTSSIGRFLVWSGLDRLPALTGVWKGELSLVGPEPLSLGYYPPLSAYVQLVGRPRQEAEMLLLERTRVAPGLFGPSQFQASVSPGAKTCLGHLETDRWYSSLDPVRGVLLTLLFAILVWPVTLLMQTATYALNLMGVTDVYPADAYAVLRRIGRGLVQLDLSVWAERPVVPYVPAELREVPSFIQAERVRAATLYASATRFVFS